MPNTTNFNWTTPADTDLVKDGALAIRTLANGIDTSLVDLKGGTTGQVLAKATNTDLDFSWVAQDDSNAIQNAIIDAKGDLIVGTAADTPSRLAVGGTNGHVLTVDSGETSGLKWAATVANSLTQLATGSLTSTSVDITSISGSYTHLQLWIYEMSANANGGFRMQFNSDTGSNYFYVQTDSRATDNDSASATTYINIQTEGNAGSSTKGTNVINIYGYSSTSIRKTLDGVYFGDRNTVGLKAGNLAGAWDNTSAITSIQIFPEPSNSFDNGTYILYGVK